MRNCRPFARRPALPAGRGAAAFHQGEPAAHFFVLLHGCLKVTQVTPDGEQVLVRYVNPGDLFGLARAMRQACYPASVVAVESVCSWPAAAWDEFAASHPRLNAAALQTMGRRLQDAHLRIQELSTDEVEQRVARAMLRLFEQSGQPVADGIGIGFPITRQDIAELTGTTLHTVSRLLNDWKQRGIVDCGRKRVAPRCRRAAAGAWPGCATARAACPVSMDRRRTVRRGSGRTRCRADSPLLPRRGTGRRRGVRARGPGTRAGRPVTHGVDENHPVETA